MSQTLYSDKESLALVTAAALRFGVRHWVVCPGSRNAPLVHNLFLAQATDGGLWLTSCTDERSAAFRAIGIWEATHRPVGVCVTSGSALLNTLPAVAEAFYRQIPLLIVSADRPKERIGQLDGQTIPQTGALLPYAETVTLNEHEGESESLCRGLDRLRRQPGRPLHVNLPLAEPLGCFTRATLPMAGLAPTASDSVFQATDEHQNANLLKDVLIKSVRPLFICGQFEEEGLAEALREIERRGWGYVLTDLVHRSPFQQRLALLESDAEARALLLDGQPLSPDLVVHLGGNLIGRRVKEALQTLRVPIVRLGFETPPPCTFGAVSSAICAHPTAVLRTLLDEDLILHKAKAHRAAQMLDEMVRKRHRMHHSDPSEPHRTLRLWWQYLATAPNADETAVFHIANSRILRAVAETMPSGAFEVHCNRGVNGIEGSLSAAVGFSLARPDVKNFVFIGDLSFFYDMGALFCGTPLPGNLRMVLFNDGGGGIFHTLDTTRHSPALGTYIAASHRHSARGICQTFGIDYREHPVGTADLDTFFKWVARNSCSRARLLELTLTD